MCVCVRVRACVCLYVCTHVCVCEREREWIQYASMVNDSLTSFGVELGLRAHVV